MAAAPARTPGARSAPAGPRPPGRSLRTSFGLLMVLFLLLGAGILAGRLHHQAAPSGGALAGSGRLRITGSISSKTASPGCASAPNVVHKGASVVVLDPNGAVLANTYLGAGTPTADGTCIWRYTVVVPSTVAYQVQVAGVPPVAVSREQIQRSGGRFSQTDVQPTPGGATLDSGL